MNQRGNVIIKNEELISCRGKAVISPDSFSTSAQKSLLTTIAAPDCMTGESRGDQKLLEVCHNGNHSVEGKIPCMRHLSTGSLQWASSFCIIKESA